MSERWSKVAAEGKGAPQGVLAAPRPFKPAPEEVVFDWIEAALDGALDKALYPTDYRPNAVHLAQAVVDALGLDRIECRACGMHDLAPCDEAPHHVWLWTMGGPRG